MKNQITKFLIMLFTVIVIGSGATMLNLNLQEKNARTTFAYPGDASEEIRETKVVNEAENRVIETGVLQEDESLITQPALCSDNVEAAEANETAAACEPYTVYRQGSKDHTFSDEKLAYYARLEDMEKIYATRMNEVKKESLSIQQSAAEALLKCWDDELNAIYQKLRTALPENEFYELRSEERAWLRNRDEAANRAASRENYSNSTSNLAYTRSLLEWTRKRVYELAAMYYGE